jgi:hypothetical protein
MKGMFEKSMHGTKIAFLKTFSEQISKKTKAGNVSTPEDW